jgi:MraZ protein
MTHFLGTHTNRIDAKGRVSIPASYRATLRTLVLEGAPPLVLRSSHKYPCIECWPARYFEELAPPLDKMDVFDDDHDDLAMALYPDAEHFDPDKEGRIALPDELVKHAGLKESVFFMGLGRIFQIWEPAAAAAARAVARDRARQKRLTLRTVTPAPALPTEASA